MLLIVSCFCLGFFVGMVFGFRMGEKLKNHGKFTDDD